MRHGEAGTCGTLGVFHRWRRFWRLGLAESLTTWVCSPFGEGSSRAERLDRREPSRVVSSWLIHRVLGTVWRMEAGRAVVTRDGGAVILDVVELEGVLVDLATGDPVDLVSLVVVTGLDELPVVELAVAA